MVAIGEDVKGMLDFARPMFALYIGGMGAKGKNFYNDLCREYGYEKEAEEIQDLYLDGKKDEAAAVVPTSCSRCATWSAPSPTSRSGSRPSRESGVTHLNVIPATDDPAATIAQLKEWIS